MNPSLKKGAWPAFQMTANRVILPEEIKKKIFRILFWEEILSNPLIRKMKFRAEDIPSPPRCEIPDNRHDRWLISMETDYEKSWRNAEWEGDQYFLGGLPLTLSTGRFRVESSVSLLARYTYQREAFTEYKRWYVLSSNLPEYHPGWTDPMNPEQIINGQEPGSYQRYVRFLMDEEEKFISGGQ